jgi:hypothetical protein
MTRTRSPGRKTLPDDIPESTGESSEVRQGHAFVSATHYEGGLTRVPFCLTTFFLSRGNPDLRLILAQPRGCRFLRRPTPCLPAVSSIRAAIVPGVASWSSSETRAECGARSSAYFKRVRSGTNPACLLYHFSIYRVKSVSPFTCSGSASRLPWTLRRSDLTRWPNAHPLGRP